MNMSVCIYNSYDSGTEFIFDVLKFQISIHHLNTKPFLLFTFIAPYTPNTKLSFSLFFLIFTCPQFHMLRHSVQERNGVDIHCINKKPNFSVFLRILPQRAVSSVLRSSPVSFGWFYHELLLDIFFTKSMAIFTSLLVKGQFNVLLWSRLLMKSDMPGLLDLRHRFITFSAFSTSWSEHLSSFSDASSKKLK